MKKKEEKKTVKPAKNQGKKRNNGAKKTTKKNAPIGNESNGKPKKAIKSRSDGIGKSVEIAQAAYREIKPPDHVRFRAKDYYFWNEIIDKFAKSDWDDESLTMAAILARTLADLEKEQAMMRREGSIIKIYKILKDKKTGKEREILTGATINPRKQLIDMYTKNILAMRRQLALHARALEGERRDIEKRRGAAKQTENNILHDDDDDLLARPTLQ